MKFIDKLKESKNKKSTIIFTTILVLFLLIGFSFAFFSANVNEKNKTETVISTKRLALVFDDTKEVDVQNFIPGDKVQKTFSVTSEADDPLIYNIRIRDIENTYNEDVVYTLYRDGTKISGPTRLPQTQNMKYILTGVGINPGEKHDYIFEIEYINRDYAQNPEGSSEFSGVIEIDTATDVGTVDEEFATTNQISNTGSTIEFQVTNPSSTNPKTYNVKLDDLVNSYQDGATYKLYKNGELIDEGVLPHPGESTYLLTNQQLQPGATDSYRLVIENVDGTQDLSAKVVIDDDPNVDVTAPEATMEYVGKTTNSVTYKASCSDSDSGVNKYEFYLDGVLVNTINTTNPEVEYTFVNVTSGEHEFAFSCNNNYAITSKVGNNESPTELEEPEVNFEDGYATSKDVTLTFSGEGDHIFVTTAPATSNVEVIPCVEETNERYVCEGEPTTNIEPGVYYKTTDSNLVLTFETSGSITTKTVDGTNVKENTTEVTGIDGTEPEAEMTYNSGSSSSNSTTFNLTGEDNESGIIRYDIYLDDVLIDTLYPPFPESYTYTGITSGTHTYKIVAVNGAGITKEIEIEKTTEELETPTYDVEPGYSQSKDVELNFEGEGDYIFKVTGSATSNVDVIPCVENSSSSYTCEGTPTKQLQEGVWYKTTESKPVITFESNGSVIAKVVDGTNEKAGSSLDVNGIDTTGPSIETETTYESDTWTNQNVVITLDSNDTESGFDHYEVKQGDDWVVLDSNEITYTDDNNGVITYRAVDKVGNVSEEKTIVLKIDKTKPTVTFTPNGSNTYTKSRTIAIDADDNLSGISELKYQWTQSISTPAADSFTESIDSGDEITKDGISGNNWYLWVYAKDSAGNERITKSDEYYFDNKGPINCTITGNSNTWSSNIELTVSAEDEHVGGVTYRWQDGTTGATLSNITTNGEYTAYATDSLGNESSCSTTISKIDTTKPTLEVQTPYESDTWTNNNVTVTLFGTDEESTIDYYEINTGSGFTQTSSNVVEFSDDINATVKFRAVDKVGNISDESTVNIKIDKTKPEVAYTPDKNEEYAKSQSSKVTATDNLSDITELKYQWTTSDAEPAAETFTQDFNNDETLSKNDGSGTYYLWIYAKDNAGNVKIAKSGKFNLDNEAPTNCTITGNSDSWSTSKTLTVSAEDEHVGGVTYRWEGGATGATLSDITTNGEYTAYATDSLGNETSCSTTISKIDTTEPQVSLTPISETASSITVRGACSDAESGVSKYEFYIDDVMKQEYETSDTTKEYTYTGLTSGSHVLKLVCTNGAGNTGVVQSPHSTGELEAPGYSLPEGYAQSKNVTVNYKGAEGDHLLYVTGNVTASSIPLVVCSQNNDSSYTCGGDATTTPANSTWYKVTTSEDPVLTYTSNGVVIAKTADGTNNKQSSLNVNGIDRTNPAKPTLTNSTNGEWTNSSVNVTMTSSDTAGTNESASGINTFEYSYDNTNWTAYSDSQVANDSLTDTWSEERNSTLYIRAKDNAGNYSEVSETTIKIDKTGPSVTFGTNGNNVYAKSQSTTVSVADSGSNIDASTFKYQWTQSTTAPAANTFATAFTNNEEISKDAVTGDDWYLWIYAEDNLGNKTITNSNAFYLDNTAPTGCSIGGNNNTCSISKTLTMDTAIDANNGIVEYSWDATSWSSTKSDKVVSETGTYTLYVRDGLGNATSCDEEVTAIDNQAPSISFGTNGNNTLKQSQSTKVTVSDEGCSEVSVRKYAWSTNGTTAPSDIKTSGTDFDNNATITKDGVTGDYYLWVYAKDALGNEKTAHSNVFKLDNTAPSISFGTNGNSTAAKSQSSTIIVTNDAGGSELDTSSYKYIWSTDNTATPSEEFTSGTSYSQSSGNGNYYLRATACDSLGNCTTQTSNVFKLDNTAPSISFGTNGNSTAAKSQASTITVTNDSYGASLNTSSYKYIWSTSNTAEPTTAFTSGTSYSQSSGNGNYYLRATACDSLGNCTTATSSAFKLDNTGPSISFGTNGNSTAAKSQSSTITVTNDSYGASLNTSSYKYIWSTSNTAEPTTAFTSGTSYSQSSGNGTYYLRATACDSLGNCTTETTAAFKLDNTAPSISFGTNGNSTPAKSQSSTISVTNDSYGSALNTSSYKYIWSTSNTATPATAFTSGTSYSQTSGTGSYYLRATACDQAGNCATSTSNVFKLDNTGPTITFGTNGNSTYKKSQASTITVTNDAGGSALSTSTYKYIWSTSNTATPTTAFTSGTSYSQSSGTGNYYLRATACDSLSNCTTATSNVFKLDNTGPTCTIPTITYSPASGTYANSVSLTASGTDAHVGGTVTYKWTKPDATTATTATISGQTENGTYTVVCSDSLGNTTSTNVSISKLYYDSANITYTGNGQTTVKGALDDLYSKLN